jgi:short-subunit dehydrogenase
MYALVTGASAGIGLEITRYLAQKGYDLIITARREDRLQKLREQILEKYPNQKVIVIAADLSKREECGRLFTESCAQAGSHNIDFVVNNAGMGVYGLFLDTDLEKELTLIDLNVTSVHILSKLFLREMVKNGHGVLLNVGSCAGFTSGPTFSSYYASKNYVVRLTEAIHEELRQAHSPVKVCCLCPGPVDTAFNKNSGVAVSGKQITAKQAAREGVDGALAGRMIVIPGIKMKLVTVGSHLLGEHLSTVINYHIQKKKAGKKE